ncbi:MAG: penicillin-binding protein [Nocardioides sp.]
MSRSGEGGPAREQVVSHLSVMGVVALLMGLISAGLAIPFVGAVGLGTKQVAESMKSFPAELDTPPLAEKTVVLDAEGKPIAQFFDQNRVNIKLSQVAPIMVRSIVAIEDYRFYQHGAIDLKGTLRALLRNKAAGGEVVQGGSSITQQTVKLTLLANAGADEAKMKEATDDTYERKIKELRYGIALEEKHSKDWILERYLNTAYFGQGAYGIQAAARHYFNKPASQLELPESALLAGLVKSPDNYNPSRHEDRAVGRRNVVLNRMAELNVITEAERDKAKQTDLGLEIRNIRNGCVKSPAPRFCQYLESYLLADESFAATPEEREKLLRAGGLTIRTTLNMRYQRAADAAVRRKVFARDQAIGGLAMVEPGTGAVRALAQSRPMGRKEKQGETFLNYVVPSRLGDSNGFQAGSTFKAFTLAAALERGIPLTQQIKAPEPVQIAQTEFDVCNGKSYDNSDIWDPENSTANGTFNLYQGTQLSVNTFYAQLELSTGICAPYQMAKKMGIDLSREDRASELSPSFTLGVLDVSPLEMAEAYATFAARGKHCASTPITSIDNAEGELFKEYQPSCEQVFPEAVADGVNDVLRGVIAPGGFAQNQALNVPAAGKTGTTSSTRAVWFVGYTPQLSTAAMIAGANSKGEPIPLPGLTVGGDYISFDEASGSGFAAPVWGDAMRSVQDTFRGDDFVPPDLSGIQANWAQVPSVQGMSIGSATAVLRQAGFKVAIGPPESGRAPQGAVANAFPAGGSSAPVGMAVLISPSTGQAAEQCKKKNPRKCRDDDDDNRRGRGGGGFTFP